MTDKIIRSVRTKHQDGREITGHLVEDGSIEFVFKNPTEPNPDGTPFETSIRLSEEGLAAVGIIYNNLKD